jgi:hypothetical protein
MHPQRGGAQEAAGYRCRDRDKQHEIAHVETSYCCYGYRGGWPFLIYKRMSEP